MQVFALSCRRNRQVCRLITFPGLIMPWTARVSARVWARGAGHVAHPVFGPSSGQPQGERAPSTPDALELHTSWGVGSHLNVPHVGKPFLLFVVSSLVKTKERGW